MNWTQKIEVYVKAARTKKYYIQPANLISSLFKSHDHNNWKCFFFLLTLIFYLLQVKLWIFRQCPLPSRYRLQHWRRTKQNSAFPQFCKVSIALSTFSISSSNSICTFSLANRQKVKKRNFESTGKDAQDKLTLSFREWLYDAFTSLQISTSGGLNWTAFI